MEIEGNIKITPIEKIFVFFKIYFGYHYMFN